MARRKLTTRTTPTKVERKEIAVARKLAPATRHPAVKAAGALSELGDQPPLYAISGGVIVRRARGGQPGERVAVRMLAGLRMGPSPRRDHAQPVDSKRDSSASVDDANAERRQGPDELEYAEGSFARRAHYGELDRGVVRASRARRLIGRGAATARRGRRVRAGRSGAHRSATLQVGGALRRSARRGRRVSLVVGPSATLHLAGLLPVDA